MNSGKNFSKPFGLLLLCCALLLQTSSLPCQSTGETFAKARRLEIEEAQIQKALPLYELVLQDPQAPTSMKARALYRKAICYLKLEEYTKAGKTLTRIEKVFPKTDEAVQAKLLRRSLGNGSKGLTPRHELSLEIQDLLVAGTSSLYKKNGWDLFSKSLARLRLLGAQAIPELRKASKKSQGNIKNLALVALAYLGDEGTYEPLVKRLESRYPDILRQKPIELLIHLGKKKPGIILRLKEDYAHSRGRSKANLLRVLYELDPNSKEADFHPYLDSKDPSLLETAWDLFQKTAEKSQEASKNYMEKLLQSWKAQTGFNPILAQKLAGALRLAEKAGKPLWDQWARALLNTAKKMEWPFAKALSKALQVANYPPAIPIRSALLPYYFKKDWNQKGLVDPLNCWKPSSSLFFLLHQTVAKARKTLPLSPGRTLQVLQRVAEMLACLTPKETTQLFLYWIQDGFLDQCLSKAKELASKPFSLRNNFIVSLIGQFSFSSTSGKPIDQIETFLELGEKKIPPALAWAGLLGIQRTLSQLCHQSKPPSLPKKLLTRIRNYILQTQEVRVFKKAPNPYPNCLQAIWYDLLLLPHGLSLFQAFSHLKLQGKDYDYAILSLIKKALQREDSFKLFMRLVHDPKVREDNLLKWIHAFHLNPENENRALRALWERSNKKDLGVLWKLPPTESNLQFLLQQIQLLKEKTPSEGFRQWAMLLPISKRSSLLAKLLAVSPAKTIIRVCKDLESLADPIAAPALINLLTYPDLKVRKAAESALQSIRNIKKNQKAWREWYEKLKKGKGKQG